MKGNFWLFIIFAAVMAISATAWGGTSVYVETNSICYDAAPYGGAVYVENTGWPYRHYWWPDHHSRVVHHGYRVYYYPKPTYRIYRSRPYYSVSYEVTEGYCPKTVKVYTGIPTVTIVKPDRETPPVRVVDESLIRFSKQAELIEVLMRSASEKRRQAAEDLTEYANLSAVAALIDALINDGDSSVRAEAAESLGKIAHPLAYEVLLRSEQSETDEAAQQAAAQAAEKIREKTDLEGVYLSQRMPPMNEGKAKLGEYLEALRYGQADQRKKAAGKLDDYHGTQSVAALINVLINDPAKEVRKEAADSLGELGDRMALGFLKAAQYDDESKSVRKEAEKAVDKIYKTIL